MITAIIETRDNEVDLARTLVALVPAATEGVVREVIVVDHGSSDGTLIVADEAGCTIIEAEKVGGDARQLAAERARGDWLLFLSPTSALTTGWQAGAVAFIDRALVTGRAQSRAAAISGGTVRTGLWAWLRSLVFTEQGRLVAKTAYVAANASSPLSSALSASGARRGAA